MPRPANCPRCGNCHVGVLMFASAGFMILFRNEWEQELSEPDFDAWLRERLPLHNTPIRMSSMREFLAMVHS